MDGAIARVGRCALADHTVTQEHIMGNVQAKTPNLRTNFVNNGLLKRQEKTTMTRLLTNVVGADGVNVRNDGKRIRIGLDASTRDKIGGSSGSENPYHFEVVKASTTTVKVRGGWWAYYEGIARTQVDLSDGGIGTIPSFDDLTAALTVTDTGVIYIELDDSSETPTLTAKFATDAAWAAIVDTADIYQKLIADIDFADSVITTIKQNWRGGNINSILAGGPAFDTDDPADVAASAVVGTSEELSRSDHVHRAPHWQEMQVATADTDMLCTANTEELHIGKIEDSLTNADPWAVIQAAASGSIQIEQGDYNHGTTGGAGAWIYLSDADIDMETHHGDITAYADGNIVMVADDGLACFGSLDDDCRIQAGGGDLELSAYPTVSHDPAYVFVNLTPIAAAAALFKISDLPTSDPSDTDVVYTQTAAQLGGTGSTRVLCISG